MADQHLSADSAYASRRKQHMALINQLRAIGAQADLDLPRIVVIGNQSAGKSSLVEAISGISVPRDAGTCTRCPMECRLSQSAGEWQCQVSIRWEFRTNGTRVNEVKEIPFGPVITSRSDVELILRRAQAAVLNPKRPASKWLKTGSDDLKGPWKLSFSKNTVCVDLQGPELTELAFVDLPGIIQNAESETVDFVEELVLSHIRGNCLILVTLPMSDDIENQKAARLAQQEDPNGLRTIGVLTKPDTLPSGASKSRKLWLDVVEGRRFPLNHGYYCTRQPDDDERTNGITTEDARRAEQEFFQATKPWSQSSHPLRFGTTNLIHNVSQLLSQIIDKSLPGLQAQIKAQLELCNAALAKLPPPINTEPASYLLNTITSFCQDIRLSVRGDPDRSELVQANRQIYTSYKHDVRSSAPQFLPFVDKSDITTNVAMYLALDDEGNDNGDELTLDHEVYVQPIKRYIFLQDVKRHIEKSLTRELPNNVPYAAKVSLMQSSRSTWQDDSLKCFENIYRVLRRTVTKLVDDKFGRYENLRDHVKRFILELLQFKREETLRQIEIMLRWESSPYTQNSHYYQVTKEKYLTKYKAARAGQISVSPPTKRQKRVEYTMEPDKISYDDHSAVASPEPAPINSKTSMEEPVPSWKEYDEEPADDEDEDLEEDCQQQQLSESKRSNHSSNSSNQGGSSHSGDIINKFNKRPLAGDEERENLERQALSALAALGYNVTPADFGKLVPPDLYEREMDIMAEVRAYFHVAYKRVIDNIPMAIDNTFLFDFAESLQSFLIEKFGLGTADAATRCATYLAENTDIIAQREELTNKKRRLDAIQAEIHNFGVV